MSVRELTSTEDLLECGRIQNIAFVSPWDPEKSRRELEKPDARRNPVFGNFNAEGRLTACMCFPFYQVAYEGGTVSMAGVGGVASLPECRQGGRGARNLPGRSALDAETGRGVLRPLSLLPPVLPPVRL